MESSVLILICSQRESSATIKAPPISYKQASPPTRQKIIEFDCRGLEFTEFKPEVSKFVLHDGRGTADGPRGVGSPLA